MTLIDQIVELEAKLPDVKASRAKNGIPALDGAPTPWLERYLAALQAATARPSLAPPDLDAWWAEQTQRVPPRFQVWRVAAGGRRCLRLLGSTSSQAKACEIARAEPPAVVLDGKLGLDAGYVLRVSGTKRKTESGPLAAPPPEPPALLRLLERIRRVAMAPDGTIVRELRLNPAAARDIVEWLQEGGLTWRASAPGSRRVQPGRRVKVERIPDIRIVVEKGRAVVRRDSHPKPVPA